MHPFSSAYPRQGRGGAGAPNIGREAGYALDRWRQSNRDRQSFTLAPNLGLPIKLTQTREERPLPGGLQLRTFLL